jgi:hypothetical protein
MKTCQAQIAYGQSPRLTKEAIVWLDMLAKDGNSNPDGCPSVYIAEDGSLVVQGRLVNGDTQGNLDNVLPGEGAVHIAPEVVIAAAAAYQRRSR